MNVVSYHVGNHALLRPIFCEKGPEVKIGKVRGLNHSCSDRLHILFGIVKSVTIASLLLLRF